MCTCVWLPWLSFASWSQIAPMSVTCAWFKHTLLENVITCHWLRLTKALSYCHAHAHAHAHAIFISTTTKSNHLYNWSMYFNKQHFFSNRLHHQSMYVNNQGCRLCSARTQWKRQKLTSYSLFSVGLSHPRCHHLKRTRASKWAWRQSIWCNKEKHEANSMQESHYICYYIILHYVIIFFIS